MAQTAQLIDTLKHSLKAQHKTYQHVADKLGLSLASVKRLFSEKNLSLQRLDQICQILDMEISDLVQRMNAQQRQLNHLTEEQETEIAADPLLLLITVCVLNRWRMEDILTFYHIPETQCIQVLAKLDRLKLIELLPGNRIKLLVSANFAWLENGPIQRFFHAKVESEFFNSKFKRETERLIVINGMLTDSSNAILQRKLERLATEFDQLNSEDSGLELHQRHGTTVVLAVRQWQYGLFKTLQRETIKNPTAKP